MLNSIVRFCLERKLIVFLVLLGSIFWGILVAPFQWDLFGLPRDPVPVDAIPDIGENQQIIYTRWPGRSPQDIEDQISYPLTVSLLGIPGVKTVRSYSMFGFSTVYVIFDESIEFYWSRSRILEKLASLPPTALPPAVKPSLGPDATALGQVFWYTLEGRDQDGQPAGGWDPHELRSIQDWYVRYALQTAEGVSEVASVGGYVKEFQVDVDPAALRAHNVTLKDVINAVKNSNLDVGARSIEINRVEYVIRGLGFLKNLADIESTVVAVRNHVPIRVKDIAVVKTGPALRRGVLDMGGTGAVGGVVVSRYGANPLATINAVHKKIKSISAGLPSKKLADGRTSQVTIVPFYDRSKLIYETLDTLNTALIDEILITILVVILMLRHLRSSILIAGLLPISVLLCFIAMRVGKVDANIVALSGIAIAIGTMVDVGVVLCENILSHLKASSPDQSRLEVVYQATIEVAGAVLTAIATTVVSFLPVFAMTGEEGRLFRPLAYTKTFALLASIAVALTIIPALAHLFFERTGDQKKSPVTVIVMSWILGFICVLMFQYGLQFFSVACFIVGLFSLFQERLSPRTEQILSILVNAFVVCFVAYGLAEHWKPLGESVSVWQNFSFVISLVGGLILAFQLFMVLYPTLLRWCLDHKIWFFALPTFTVLLGLSIWLGFGSFFSFVPKAAEYSGVSQNTIRQSRFWIGAERLLPGLGKEFMPDLDEGAFLFMPTTMPHASISEAEQVLAELDKAILSIPEVEQAVGKTGRVESALDPAPISMVETIVNYKSEYLTDHNGRKLLFAFDSRSNQFVRDSQKQLVEDPNGRPFRQWRKHIKSPDDIWNEIVRVTKQLGVTSAPHLQPIAARLVMLQSGMRAPMGIKVQGPDLETIDNFGLKLEAILKTIPGVQPAAVLADRVVGKPYLEIDIDRQAISRYGMLISDVQQVIEVAIGGKALSQTIQGRERYPVRVRYMRDLRDNLEQLERILVSGRDGVQVPLKQVAKIRFVRGPQVIKSEDTFLLSYVLFDKKRGFAEVDVIENCKKGLDLAIKNGELIVPPGVTFTFAGSYENQIRASKRLAVVLPIALFLIFLILYIQFNRFSTTLFVFVGIVVAWSGGFLMIWAYGQPWFLDFSIFGIHLRSLFQIETVNLSVAVWVGFIALFGIASDDGVVIASYLDQSFAKHESDSSLESVQAIREVVVEAGKRRIRACLMTTATTLLALIPILTSTGRGSDIMLPMAIPSFGGMALELMTLFVVPTLYCAVKEWEWLSQAGKQNLENTLI